MLVLQEIPFNLNQSVKVKLTPFGIAVLRGQHEELNKRIKSNGGNGLGTFEVKTDDEGYTTFQMWDLFQQLGEHIGMGHELPIDINIKLICKSESF